MDYRGRPSWELTASYATENPGGVVSPSVVIDTQLVVSATMPVDTSVVREGVEFIDPFTHARLYGEVVSGAAGRLYVECLSGASWVTLGDTATVELALSSAGFTIGTVCQRRAAWTGDVTWRVRAVGSGASVRNVNLQWLKGYALPTPLPPVDGDDPVCAFYNMAATSATYPTMFSWAAAGASNEYRAVGSTGSGAANAMTAEGPRFVGGLPTSSNTFKTRAWHATRSPERVLYRCRLKGKWLRRSSQYRVVLAGLYGTNENYLEIVIWNNALASHGIDKDRVWIKHSVQNPDYDAMAAHPGMYYQNDTTPGPLIADVLNETDYEFFLLQEDWDTPDGAGEHDVLQAVWGGPVGGPHKLWLFVVGKPGRAGAINPTRFTLAYAKGPQVEKEYGLAGQTVWTNSAAGTPITAYGDGPYEVAGQSGDYIILRGMLLATDDCVDSDGLGTTRPPTVETPPAPLALPTYQILFEQQLFFPNGTATSTGSEQHVGTETIPARPELIYRDVWASNGQAVAIAEGESATLTASGTDHFEGSDVNNPGVGLAVAVAGAQSLDVAGNALGPVYWFEADFDNIADLTYYGPPCFPPQWTNVGGSRWRYNYQWQPLPIGDSSFVGQRYFTILFDAIGELDRPNLCESPNFTDNQWYSRPDHTAIFIERSFTVSNVRVYRFGIPEGY